MRGRLRRAAPWPLFAPMAIVIAISECLIRLLGAAGDPHAHRVSIGAFYLAAAAFGVYRACAPHPFFRQGYRSWLANTPWTVDKPLPFGAIELDWPDAVILGAMILLYALIPGHQSVRLISLFLFFHGLFLTISVFPAANHVPAYTALFGLGLMVRLWPQPWACAATGVVVYLILYDGLRIALRAFASPCQVSTTTGGSERPTFDPDRAECGWPYDRLLKEPVHARADATAAAPSVDALRGLNARVEDLPWRRLVGSTLDDLMWSLLLGWWASCFGPFLAERDRYRAFLLIVAGFVLFASMISRISMYKIGYESPITPWGRLWTGRWIIPGYDVVFVGLLLIPIAPALTLGGCLARGVPWRIAGPIALGVMLFVALATPPSLRRWRLVGRHRMTPGQQKAGTGA